MDINLKFKNKKVKITASFGVTSLIDNDDIKCPYCKSIDNIKGRNKVISFKE